ncbi:hypothetical protein BL250_14770 [Erwinia sp. OLTSP20]|uniref:GNAT family N-acetyltransferase n=1 Tax=unclassified Erwinia TaxID=2622719 RepID=UPI000C42E737|nr:MULTISPECIES: GNAT family protein [unclassified Erwinia]PIJ50370.1 hypothetical protein BV501_08730 [Erwinia sp. OAMSP11]PIJ71629.1 hypothetical protein BK416_11110 [Erwinia sp. OLSSP12]PIJ81013.1 hypothetical protein BLD47_09970 [Erwinia sp. OLCASP19]PIJ83271.1 hypothetical protein BLD46_09970 [Erwinia sp. OLMTSP26]PIJ85951.1 hypothetical protein BLD49_09275 [Erwinia sp. OLMDSP33]
MHVDRFTTADLPEFTRWFNHADEVLQFGGPELAFPFSAAFLRSLSNPQADNTPGITFAGRINGELVGSAQLHFHRQQHMAVLARVVINPAWRGKGLALPLLKPVVDFFFADITMQRLELSVYSFNNAAIRTYKKLGFVYEGIRRGNVQASNGQRWDTLIYGMLREDYLTMRARSAA